MTAKPTNFDEYLAAAPEHTQGTLVGLRQTIKTLVPDAVEVFGYGMPGFKLRGKPHVYFAGWKGHCALYGLPADLHLEELADFDLDKGTIRFQPDHPLSHVLLQSLVNDRVAAIEALTPPRTATRS